MKHIVPFAILALAALSACAPSDTATRAAPTADPILAAPTPAERYAVGSLSVLVPEKLVVSEANSYIPRGDIVWRGDPFGDRREQVKSLFVDSIQQAGLTDGRKVDVTIQVVRFHGLSEKARYVTGGFYAMHFWLTLTDPATGQQLVHKLVRYSLPQAGGYTAMLNDHNGRTERVIVEEYLRKHLAEELGHAV